jgi:hypothetical protein
MNPIKAIAILFLMIGQMLFLAFCFTAFIFLDFDMMTKQGQVTALAFVAYVCYLWWKQPYRFKTKSNDLHGDG